MKHGDKISSFQNLLGTDKFVSIHQRISKLLATEMFMGGNNITPGFLDEVLNQELYSKNCRIITALNEVQCFPYFNGTGILSYAGPKYFGI